jgi:protein gp37
MGRDTSIAWADSTLNLAWGCTKVDRGELGGCTKCYMFRLSRQWSIDPEKVKLFDVDKIRKKVNSWPVYKRIIFVNSMSDTFHEKIPFETIELWHKLFESFPARNFLLLTKRIGRAMVFYRQRAEGVPVNVWVGTSIGQRNRLWRLDQLRQIPARVRFVSFEPLLEDLGDFSLEGIQWAIVGGESDYENPRPMNPEWAESIRRICQRDGVSFFFKQLGGKGGDGAGGDLLNGNRYQEWPLGNSK